MHAVFEAEVKSVMDDLVTDVVDTVEKESSIKEPEKSTDRYLYLHNSVCFFFAKVTEF